MRSVIASSVLLVVAAAVPAQDPPFPIDFGPRATSFADVAAATVTVSPKTAKPGEGVTIQLPVTPKSFCWTYPAFVPDQASKSFVEIPPAGDLIFLDKVTDPPGHKPKKGAKPGEE